MYRRKRAGNNAILMTLKEMNTDKESLAGAEHVYICDFP